MPTRRLPAPPLELYHAKRDFSATPEPRGDAAPAHRGPLAYVIQKHAATRLHYDLRLEHDGVMWSWAVPKGPSVDPADKRIAMRTEDHPIAYNRFEGTIPKGHYGAGTVIVWDRGTWQPAGDPARGLADGKLLFTLDGLKLKGQWELVRIKPKDGERGDPWILFKKRDAHARARADYDVVRALPDSVGPQPAAAASAPAASRDTKPRARAAGFTLPPGALKATPPAALAPQLATQANGLPVHGTDGAPADGGWIFEIKLDGYRMLARFDGGAAAPRLFTRNGHDWSARMQPLQRELAALKLKASWLDGEVVVPGPDGLPRFNALQNAFDAADTSDIVYYVFDLPYFEGHDLRAVPLRERRRLLEALLEQRGSEHVRLSATFDADPVQLMQSIEALKLEGLIAKRADSPYVSRRTDSWLKLKSRQRQEFVIAGFTDRSGDPRAAEIGSLVLAVHDEHGRLRPAGNVGTGWSAKTAALLKTRLLKLEVGAPPFEPAAAGDGKSKRWPKKSTWPERWVKPQLVADVNFADWTPDGSIRHATFVALRDDKPARQVQRETVATPAGALPIRRDKPLTKVSNPARVIDARSGLTKLDLVRYYESVSDWLLPHLKGRPCSLVRAPDGLGGEVFFQKHLGKLEIAGITALDPALWPQHEPLLEVGSALAIANAAQLNVIEFHTWNASVRRIDAPDRMVFDLDPGEGLAWSRMQEAATLVHGFLAELGLHAWLKTSGGKGLHVVVPLAPRHDWDTVKGFSQAVVEHLAQVVPLRFSARSGAHNRIGKVFVDYLRNSHGATTAAAYSARARPGLGVSMPVRWDDLGALKSGAQWTIADAREHLSFQRADPWADYWRCRQTLLRAMKRLGYNTSAPA
ncbi:MAG: DNA ligase D [Ideonella sp.]|nr:DNA ligase D [Ideonella sp.]MCC7458572.1 DNA ligase D [Nitrospira sp.]